MGDIRQIQQILKSYAGISSSKVIITKQIFSIPENCRELLIKVIVSDKELFETSEVMSKLTSNKLLEEHIEGFKENFTKIEYKIEYL